MFTEWLEVSFPVTLEKYQVLAERMGYKFSIGHDVCNVPSRCLSRDVTYVVGNSEQRPMLVVI